MEELLQHLLNHSETIAFVENDAQISFARFVTEVHKTSAEIEEQWLPKPFVFEWNFASTYQNIVVLFAFANCGGIIVPKNSVQRLFPAHRKKSIRAFGTDVCVIEKVKTVCTDELNRRNHSGIVISTSGTGGMAKDIVIDFDLLAQKYVRLKSKFTTVLTFSLEHISGIETLLSILTPGGTVILESQRTPINIAQAIKKNKATLIASTPSFLIQLFLKDLYTNEFFSSVEIINCGGEPLSSFWLNALHNKLPCISLRQAFGSTESTNVKTITHPENRTKFKPGIINVDYKIQDEVLYLKNRHFMLGNWSENNLVRAEWIETTDLVEVDEAGFIEILGRKETLISVGGNKVNPLEVEHVLLQRKEISYAKVYGEKNAILGQVVVADIISEISDSEILKELCRKHCRALLAEYKIPVKIRLLNELTMNDRFKSIVP